MGTVMKVDLLQEARRIGPRLRANAERSDREGRLPAASFEAIRDAGLLRLFVPHALGGLEVDPMTHATIQEELARHDSAAAWVLQVVSPSAWFISRLPTEAVREIYGECPDVMLAGVFGFPAEARAEDGGFRLSGQRPFASFAADATWHWITALNMQNGGPETVDGNPVVRSCFFPAGEDRIVQTWDTSGMRGTDSNDLDVDGVFVPATRTFRIGMDHAPGPLYDGPLYRVAFTAVLAAILPPVALGVAREAIDEVVALASGKTPLSSSTTA